MIPAEVEVEGRTLRLLSPTDSVKDRLAGYIHWKSRANFDQALLICRRQRERVDLDAVRGWCLREGGGVTGAEAHAHESQFDDGSGVKLGSLVQPCPHRSVIRMSGERLASRKLTSSSQLMGSLQEFV